MKRHFNSMPIIVAFLLAVAALAFIIGNEVGQQSAAARTIIATQERPIISSGTNNPSSASTNSNSVSLLLPAVNENNQGAVARLNIEAKPANSGGTYVRIDGNQPLVGDDTRNSIDNALAAVKAYSAEDADKLQRSDLLFSFSLAPEVVEGQSAGAATAVGTLALVEGKALRREFAITGMVNRNGSIGKVGGVLEKARALKAAGITTFLVPVGEATVNISRVIEEQNCTTQQLNNGQVRNCEVNSRVETSEVNVGEETGLEVREVADIAAAFELMAS